MFGTKKSGAPENDANINNRDSNNRSGHLPRATCELACYRPLRAAAPAGFLGPQGSSSSGSFYKWENQGPEK